MTAKIEPIFPEAHPSRQALLGAIQALNPMRYAGAELLDARDELHEAKVEMERAFDEILAQAATISANRELADTATALMETCAFNDIIGQRIDKVQRVLQELDDRLRQLGSDTRVSLLAEIETDSDRRRRELILHGPALHTTAATQAEIDSLFD